MPSGAKEMISIAIASQMETTSCTTFNVYDILKITAINASSLQLVAQ